MGRERYWRVQGRMNGLENRMAGESATCCGVNLAGGMGRFRNGSGAVLAVRIGQDDCVWLRSWGLGMRTEATLRWLGAYGA
jgi:hypothetical protein